jgi:hypothetical protein
MDLPSFFDGRSKISTILLMHCLQKALLFGRSPASRYATQSIDLGLITFDISSILVRSLIRKA